MHLLVEDPEARSRQVRVESSSPWLLCHPRGLLPSPGASGQRVAPELLVYPLSQAAQLPDVRAHNAALYSGVPAPQPRGTKGTEVEGMAATGLLH